MGSETLQVAVRVRPFNSREKKRGAKLIIDMNGATTSIRNPETKESKNFQFDHSYWSHDGYTEGDDGLLMSQTPKFATQKDVFNDVGIQLLKNAYAGFNTSLFAYGQTGAGKSFSMVGYGVNVGIVPLAFEELFTHIKEQTTEKQKFQVTISIVEIYSEAVYDLCSAKRSVAGLKVRENPAKGAFYIQGLTKIPVGSYEEIQARMDQGTANRTVAATKMNATSSRAHTLVTLAFNTQTIGDDGSSTTKSSEVNLIDLAGSERADSAGTTGQGLKEGAMINKSLSALGNVISALATGKKAPFRDSVLTRLLQNSLGGNARTFMIAALSPADINYDETLSTLRYADRAKQIKTKAVVNENPTDKLIRELKEANEKMRAQLAAGSEAIQLAPAATEGMSEKDKVNMRAEMEAEIRAQLEANEQEVSQVDGTNFEEQLAKAKAEWEAERAATAASTPNAEQATSKGVSKRRKTEPHMINLHQDPSLSRVLVHFLSRGENTIGKIEEKVRRRGKKGGPAAKAAAHAQEAQAAAVVSIGLSGLSIDRLHAAITVTETHRYSIDRAIAGSSAKIVVNGVPLTTTVDLHHNDRLLFGESNMFLFQDPAALSKPGKKKMIDWDDAQHELLKKQGSSQEQLYSPYLPTERAR